MHWIDLAGAMAAHRHSRSYVVTASVDHLDFLVPVHVGDLVILRSSVNRVFHTSMEVGVRSGSRTTSQTAPACRLRLSDLRGRRRSRGRLPVAPVIPETEEQQQRASKMQADAAKYDSRNWSAAAELLNLSRICDRRSHQRAFRRSVVCSA